MTTVEPPGQMCTGKTRYDSDAAAWHVALRRSRHAGPLRAYQCPICEGWHLTHRPKKEESR